MAILIIEGKLAKILYNFGFIILHMHQINTRN